MEDFNDTKKNMNNQQVSAFPTADGGLDDMLGNGSNQGSTTGDGHPNRRGSTTGDGHPNRRGSTTGDGHPARSNQTSDYSMSGQEQELTDADQLLDRNRMGNTTDNQMNM